MTTDPTDLDPEDMDPFDVDLDAAPADEPPDQSPVAGPADPLVAGISVAALAGELSGPAVRKAVGRKVDDVGDRRDRSALTPDILNQLRAEVDEAAQTVVRVGRAAQRRRRAAAVLQHRRIRPGVPATHLQAQDRRPPHVLVGGVVAVG